MPIPAQSEYETLIYGLQAAYPEIVSSSLHLYSVSTLAAIVEGDIRFANGLVLRVMEVVNFRSGRIQNYSYTVLRDTERVRWYDPQPHPELLELAPTFPHHRHEPPDIKHNRRPAPGISFTAPNLPTLVADCIALGTTPLSNS